MVPLWHARRLAPRKGEDAKGNIAWRLTQNLVIKTPTSVRRHWFRKTYLSARSPSGAQWPVSREASFRMFWDKVTEGLNPESLNPLE